MSENKKQLQPHQRKLKIRTDDQVEVISGNDKGLRGRVMRVDLKDHRVLVEGLNFAKKHQRQQSRGGQPVQAGIVQFEAPIHVSNVMVVCPNCDKPSRLSIRREGKDRIRVCKNCGEDVD